MLHIIIVYCLSMIQEKFLNSRGGNRRDKVIFNTVNSFVALSFVKLKLKSTRTNSTYISNNCLGPL